MSLHFTKTLSESFKDIDVTDYHHFFIHDVEEERTVLNADALIETYGHAKWQIIDLVNSKYSTTLKDKFDLYHWLNHNASDEVAYFLNEAGSNCLNYAEYKIPAKFHLWLGIKGFLIGIEQAGAGFNAQEVMARNQKQNEGAGFSFFQKCKNTIFFDDYQNARIIFMQQILPNPAADRTFLP
ncbi:hypothetical protein HYX14_00230 [Candidatus Woesearchaeota archaeon]|nr:hypothetical protein [Candidatus Woesearchaeota archaeon]